MTREERLKYYETAKGLKWGMSLPNVINSIYDDFESRTCDSCRHLIEMHRKHGNYCGINAVNKEGYELDNFACNKWSKKDD